MTAVALAKPLYGDPCNGCGLCCLQTQCPLSARLFGPVARCPALEPNGLGGFGCALVTDPGRLVPAMKVAAWKEANALMVGAGLGCDCTRTPEDLAARQSRLRGMHAEANRREQALSRPARAFLELMRRAR